MKTRNLFMCAFVITIACSAFTTVSNFIQDLNASEKEIKEKFMDAAINGKTNNNFYSAGGTNFLIIRNIIKGKLTVNKQEVVNNVMTYLKNYYNSAEFKVAHKKKLADLLGSLPATDSVTLKKLYEQNLKSLDAAYEANKKYTTKSYVEKTTNSNISSSKQGIDKAMEMLANNPQLAAQSGMSPEQIQQMLAQAKQVNSTGKEQAQEKINSVDEQKQKEEYQQNYEHEKELLKKHFDEDMVLLRKYYFAADAKGNIKASLTNMIAVIDDVDFSAELVNKRIFAKKEYEAKDGNWKVTYRAGKENAMLVRAAAAQWLSELK